MYKKLNASELVQKQKYFLDIIDFKSPCLCSASTLELPFFHTTKGSRLRGIFTQKSIGISTCKVFGEDLLYIFYGKPAYRVSGGEKPTSDPGPFPVTFILKAEAAMPLKRLFPFDTGALANNIYADVCEDSTNPAKYELKADSIQIQKFVSYFYDTAKNYYFRKPQINSGDIHGFSEEVRHIIALIENKSRTSSDNRGYTLEAQVDIPIPLKATHVEAIILPSNYCGNIEFDDYLYNQGIDVLPYSIDQNNPSEMLGVIAGAAKDYMERSEKGYL